MNTGIVTTAYKNGEVIDYKKIKLHGYDCVDAQEFIETDFPYFTMSESERKRLLTEELKKANDEGLEYSQVHAPMIADPTTPEELDKMVEAVKLSARAASYLNGKFLVVHPIRLCTPAGLELQKILEENEKYYREIAAYAAADFGIGVCIENMPSVISASIVSNFVRRVQIPNLYICLDTGHSHMFNEEPADAVRICGEKLAVLHVHDNDGFRDTHLDPFFGTAIWDGFGKALKETGFKGTLSLESKVKYPLEMREYYQTGRAKIAKLLTEY